jgi:beta-phosphoglucomutase-like phosphatase (HAD superfamily)
MGGAPWPIGLPNAQAQRITSRWSPAPRCARKGTARGRRLGIAPRGCAAVEDSTNGLRAACAAGMRVIAVPNRDCLPDPDELARADAVIESLDDLSEAVVDPTLR